jgi:hypothetical protein
MDAISGEIRLAHDRDFRAIRLLSEWLVDLGHNLVVYRPQGLGFAVRNTGTAATEVPPTAYTARLVHICDGGKTPDRELLDRLGKDAIHAFILSTEWADIDGELSLLLPDQDAQTEPDDDELTDAEAGIIAAEMAEEILRACPDFFKPSPSETDDPEIPF